MLRIDHAEDYKKRWPVAEAAGLIRAPSFKATPPSPLAILNADGLLDLSLVFFTGWLFTSVLNRSKERVRASLLPFGPNGESSVLALYDPATRLATPSPAAGELLDPHFFVCPLDRSGGKDLTVAQRELCPVVNKLRYNLAHARPDQSVEGLTGPDRTEDCCGSKKGRLWAYLEGTLLAEPDVYGAVAGGGGHPVRLPFAFLERYLTGIEPKNLDMGKLLEETLLWYAMAESGVVMGFAHAQPAVPIAFNEIDLLLYEPGEDRKGVTEPPSGRWEDYLARHGVCLIELTVGHHAEVAKGGAAERQRGEIGAGKDVPRNKLMNFHAVRSYGFRVTHGNYFTVLGESGLSPATARALRSTEGFTYQCLAEECGEQIEEAVLNHPDRPVPWAKVREWHGRLIGMVVDAARRFRGAL